jgi:F0F1-type ATP synthase assembly protein I
MRNWRDGANATQLFFHLSALFLTAVLVPLLLGIWLDRTLGIAPFSTLCLSVTGVLGGTAAIYRVVNRAYKKIGGRKE